MTDRHESDTETQSYREEQGKPPREDPRDRMADVPVLPTSAAVPLGPPPEEESTIDADREAARKGDEGRGHS